MTKKDPFYKAKEYAFLLLKFRLRSEKEIASRLRKKKFEEQVIKETVSFLKAKGFINDEIFARAWFESRIRRSLGLKRIAQELKLKGVPKEIIESRINEIKQGYQEFEVVKRIADERFGKLKAVEKSIARRRVYAYLLRRGFSPDVIIDALN